MLADLLPCYITTATATATTTAAISSTSSSIAASSSATVAAAGNSVLIVRRIATVVLFVSFSCFVLYRASESIGFRIPGSFTSRASFFLPDDDVSAAAYSVRIDHSSSCIFIFLICSSKVIF